MSKMISKDGTEIAYEKTAKGPALILVDGALCYRSFGPMSELARAARPDTSRSPLTTGAGAARAAIPGPTRSNARWKISTRSSRKPAGRHFVYGISSGACLALEAAIRLGKKVKKLGHVRAALQLRRRSPPGLEGLPDSSLRSCWPRAPGRCGGAVHAVGWHACRPGGRDAARRRCGRMFEAVAPTLAYDAAAMGEDRSVPLKRAAAVNVPALVMNGTANTIHAGYGHGAGKGHPACPAAHAGRPDPRCGSESPGPGAGGVLQQMKAAGNAGWITKEQP